MSGITTTVRTRNGEDGAVALFELVRSRATDENTAEVVEHWMSDLDSDVKEFTTSSTGFDGETLSTFYNVEFHPLSDHGEIVSVVELALATAGELELVHEFDESSHFTIFWKGIRV